SDYPRCDREVADLARELWGVDEPSELTGRSFGKGRVFWGGDFKRLRRSPNDENPLGSAKWIWHKEGNPAASAPPGKRFFRRAVVLDPGKQVGSATFLLTADNSFDCRVNGKLAGSGNDFNRTYELNVKEWLVPGTNWVCVEAVNAATYPN